MIMSSCSASGLVCITVTYNPKIDVLERQLEALPAAAAKIIVDNSSSNIGELAALLTRFPSVELVSLSTNIGLAAGLNRGLCVASGLEPQPQLVLLMDQDSVPLPDSVEILIATFCALERGGEKVGCVGPSLLDTVTGLSHGFHRIVGWRWTRAYPSEATSPLVCANLNGSGTLGRLHLFRQLGGLDEILFIDHVDTEWAFRLQAAGYSLWGVPAARFDHEMGATSRRYWLFGWHVWPIRSPERHAFLFRNAVRLMFRHYVPFAWKFWAVAKLLLTVVVTMMVGPHRRSHLRAMLGGVWEGLIR